MKTRTLFGLAILMVAVFALVVPQSALAAGADTNYGTTITNNVTIQYGAGPSTITTNASVDFVVDRVLDWTIGPSVAATLGVFPGSTGNAIAFSVQNATNGTVDLLLSFPASVPAPSTVALYADDGGTPGVFDGTDTLLPAGGGGFLIDEVAEDAAPTVFLVVSVAAGASTADLYSYELTAVPRAGGGAGLGAVLPDDSGNPENAALVQNVYNDGAGYTGGTGDVAGDGFYRAYAAFQVVNANLTATKTALVVNDGLGNVAPNAKAIPGATVRYTITVNNTGTAAATSVDLSDTVPGNTTYVAGTLAVTAGGGPAVVDDTGNPLLAVTGGVIAGGASMTVEFDVTID
jgi:uncharacterized repeat protein (TIGR01451 family)